MLIAISVGFYMQWNPTVIAILLGMLFMGTICYLIGICRHLIISSITEVSQVNKYQLACL